MNRREKKAQELQYVVNRIISEAGKKNLNSIGLSSSLEKNAEVQKLTESCNREIAKKEKNMQVKVLESVCHYADALEKARLCDAVILLERYSYSTYKDIARSVELLTNEDICLMGVIGIK